MLLHDIHSCYDEAMKCRKQDECVSRSYSAVCMGSYHNSISKVDYCLQLMMTQKISGSIQIISTVLGIKKSECGCIF